MINKQVWKVLSEDLIEETKEKRKTTMGIIELFLIAVGLSMDAFAVSVRGWR